MASSSDVRSHFSGRQQELERRHEVACNHQETRSFKRATGSGRDPDFVAKEQSVVLFSVSHAEMPPKALNVTEPGLRIYGTFASEQDALAHARCIQQHDAVCNLQMHATHDWIVAAKSHANLQDASYLNEKKSRILESYSSEQRRARSDFERNRKERLAGTSLPPEEVESSQIEGAPARLASGHLPRSAEVRDQQVAVISVLPDTENPECPEFLFRVYRCFDGLDNADRYVRNVASVQMEEYNIDVVSCCEWVFPQNSSAPGAISREEFRNDELNSIMDTHAKNAGEVEAFRKWEESEDLKRKEESEDLKQEDGTEV